MSESLTLRKAIQLAITTEQLGTDFYMRMERKFSNQDNLKEFFGQMVKDEIAHEAQFKVILKNAPEEEDEQERYELYQFLRATAISEFFKEDHIRKMGDITDAGEALTKALAFEKSTLLFYQAIGDIIGSSDQLDAIIKAERGHVLALMKVIVSDAKFRGLGDNW
ncbi:MAG: hypothetical protein GY839_17315 [candidate division Zixibacteria bacterium]|nr:hypothetical protein [candidate division Zixibacteria bacterium]